MHLHHAAALALVGWYLMVPPPQFHSRMPVDPDAPLSKWTVFSSYDSAAECNRDWLEHSKLAKTKLAANPSDEKARIEFHQLMSSQCIATDDPRLKEN
jgi:hypothetical protein